MTSESSTRSANVSNDAPRSGLYRSRLASSRGVSSWPVGGVAAAEIAAAGEAASLMFDDFAQVGGREPLLGGGRRRDTHRCLRGAGGGGAWASAEAARPSARRKSGGLGRVRRNFDGHPGSSASAVRRLACLSWGTNCPRHSIHTGCVTGLAAIRSRTRADRLRPRRARSCRRPPPGSARAGRSAAGAGTADGRECGGDRALGVRSDAQPREELGTAGDHRHAGDDDEFLDPPPT